MSCNNTNSTCTSCNNNYSSCNNKCTKCGCKDSFLTSPPPCPTPEACPDDIPCQEVLSSDCIIYNGPDIDCNGDIIIYEDSTWTEVLENLVEYFCTTYSNIPEISCGSDVVVINGSALNSALEQIVDYFCAAIVAIQPITADNGLTMSTIANVQLGGTLIQNTTLTNSTFALNINSTTVPALALQRTSASGFTLDVNPTATTAQAISAQSTTTGFLAPVVDVVCQSSGLIGSQAIGAKGRNNLENSGSPISAVPAVYIETSTSSAAGTTNSIALRLGSTNNGTSRSGVSIEFGNTITAGNSQAYITNRIISKKTVNTSESSMASEFVIQGKPTMTVNPVDQLTLKSTGQLQLNNYGTPNNFPGTAAWSLSTDVFGNVIQNTGGLFGTAFRATSPPLSIADVTQTLLNSEITNGVTIRPTSDYQIVNGATVTTMYDVATGIWTCPQSGYYDINYNLYLTAPGYPVSGWGATPYSPGGNPPIGQFFIGVTNNGGTTYCADYCTVMNRQYLLHLYITGGQQGVYISALTPLVLKVQNMTGVPYVTNSGDNIDWAIRRVG
jgi:hypothetical protein